jgi:DNA-nicking Smr family endonuclease
MSDPEKESVCGAIPFGQGARRLHSTPFSARRSFMKSSGAFRPFKHLRTMIQNKGVALSTDPGSPSTLSTATRGDDKTLFYAAMADVTPLKDRPSLRRQVDRNRPSPAQPVYNSEDAQVVRQLKVLVNSGKGFSWDQTAEYVEGTARCVHPNVARQLHKGCFAVQSHIDLHGLTKCQARVVFDRFLSDALERRYTAVLIIHGRGLSSPNDPVLKTSVVKWLTRHPWRRRVVAFSSARSCDGGAGATYVLLHPTSLPKRGRPREWP